MLHATLLLILSYLLGSIASAILVCRMLGLSDPRAGGSGNPGATNVLRLHGKRAAIMTLAGDVLKGVIPVLLAKLLGQPAWVVAGCGLLAFAGHLFPVFFAFKGGKGVATLIGVLFASHWLIGTGFVLTWLLVAALFRYSSLAALVAALTSPAYTWYVLQELPFIICHAIMVVLLFWRHRSNIRNLLNGSEGKIGKPKSRDPA
ncbi:MAG: glycerol-3-phosphate 1-O-acyltransferase PlsY [Gammaproteobacteria bacterium]